MTSKRIEDSNQSNHAIRSTWCRLCTSIAATFALLVAPAVYAAPATNITIDGNFSDWDSVPSYYDANAAASTPGSPVFHTGTSIPDVHDTDHSTAGGIPTYVDHPDVDLLEYKFTHDGENLHAYMRSRGVIGRTQSTGKAGRYYAIVTIDVDDDLDTGYWLHEGGYYPSSDGYDMNMEIEFYNGEINTAHYLSHDALGNAQLYQDFVNLTDGNYDPNDDGPYPVGYVQPASGNYDDYTQWVYHDNDTLTLVEDKGDIIPGIMSVALSPDGHELEFTAPFKGFLDNASGMPNLDLGKILNISFSLEASGELAPGDEWASDTSDPIVGYSVEDTFDIADINHDFQVDAADHAILISNWDMPNITPEGGNIYVDDYVDAADAGIMFSHWTGDTGPSQTVPEPTSLALAALAFGGVMASRKRRTRG